MSEDVITPCSKRGYLNKDFEFFHLKDKKDMQFEFHYHDFNKIIIFISGKVTYLIEGKVYKLKPWDILLVSSSEVHKTVIDSKDTYERVIIWVNSNFLSKHNTAECDLMTCFDIAAKQGSNLFRLSPELIQNLKYILLQLEDASSSKDFGSSVLSNSLFLQFMVYLNRLSLGSGNVMEAADIEYDEGIGSVIKYINENLSGDLTIDALASLFYMSKYYLMHKFKSKTGYTIHNYILQKRLIMANNMIRNGRPVTEACLKCGFGDYSNFVRSFKKSFGLPPKKHHKMAAEMEDFYEQNTHNSKENRTE
ncbi:MAG: AraC family transcriptional regulator [Caulobacteraceae bacterium]